MAYLVYRLIRPWCLSLGVKAALKPSSYPLWTSLHDIRRIALVFSNFREFIGSSKRTLYQEQPINSNFAVKLDLVSLQIFVMVKAKPKKMKF